MKRKVNPSNINHSHPFQDPLFLEKSEHAKHAQNTGNLKWPSFKNDINWALVGLLINAKINLGFYQIR